MLHKVLYYFVFNFQTAHFEGCARVHFFFYYFLYLQSTFMQIELICKIYLFTVK